MRKAILSTIAICAAFAFSTDVRAQGKPSYGETVNIETAKKVAAAAVAEAKKNNWQMCITVVGPSGDLVYFERMDNCQFASIVISQHKARAAARYRRPTKVFADAVGKGATPLLTLDDVIASPGGIPLISGGKLIGAIGCSGETGKEDAQTCQAGANALK